ncbi:CBS domain-containing protein [Massilia sp. W12]|uniref:CBS domain-containing protein n=1 Tax=Massilia sp. W12 TaxID=3126507 RepID=UPI0030CB2DEC
MQVAEVMSRHLVTVELDDKLSLVKEIFDHVKFHHLPVLDQGRLAGVVHERDLLRALSPNLGTLVETWRDAATLHKRVHQIMSRKPLTIAPHAALTDAVQLFNQNNITCLPVLQEDERLQGILTWHDLLKHWPGMHAAAAL